MLSPGDVRQTANKMNDPDAAQAAVATPESVLLLGDRDKLDEYKNVDVQTTGVVTPFTINSETGALGKDLPPSTFKDSSLSFASQDSPAHRRRGDGVRQSRRW